ncbi:MAG TPA: MarR family transcriptional regulator [Candidatus Mediterraneibacter stercoripullorum]|nr:MarR family transcriptional regulator [Candidatus Mediterraneibacter stercoripullorum]
MRDHKSDKAEHEHRMHDLAQMDEDTRMIINLRDISHVMRGLYEGKGSQKGILIMLRESGPVTQRELTERLGIQPGSVSEVIGKLEHAGLILRTPSESDRRTMDISLTEEGARQAEEAAENRRQRHVDMFSCLTAEEKEELLRLLEKINEDWRQRYPSAGKHGHGRCRGEKKGRHGGGHMKHVKSGE